MKRLLQGAAAFLLLSNLNSLLSTAYAQGTSFTYQGRLNSGTNLATGSFDLRFALFDAVTAGTQQGNLLTNSALAVSNGLFTVALDFGNQFPGAGRWLEIGVRTNGGGSFFTLSPRQALTPAPYAVTAGSVVSGGIGAGTYGNAVTFNNANNSFSGAFTGNGANVTNVNATKLGGVPLAGFWQTGGNVGTFPGANILGSLDNQPLELWVNDARAWRLEPGSGQPNVIGGAANNVVTSGATGGTISGGSANTNSGNFATVGGGFGNQALGNYSSVPGGYQNLANGVFSFAGGHNAVANYEGSFVWSDSTGAATDNGSNNFIVSATGGIVMNGGPGKAPFSGNQFLLNANGGNYSYWSSGAGMYLESGGEMYLNSQLGIEVNSQNAVVLESSEVDIVAPSGVVIDDSTPSISFGSTTRQMIDLYNASGFDYGIGVQTATLYLRAGQNGGFAWYSGGAHNGGQDNNGGGTTLMTLAGVTGNLIVKGTVTQNSDRNVKTNFGVVDPREVLDRVAGMPMMKWTYKTEPPGIRHLGPMAQDFYAAFNLGEDDKHITTIDEGGVALAAIQGLNQKLEKENAKLQAKVGDLQSQLDGLQKAVARLTDKAAGTIALNTHPQEENETQNENEK